MANRGAVCSGLTLFASILNPSVMSGNCLQQTTSADDIFRCIFLGALRVKCNSFQQKRTMQINHLCKANLNLSFVEQINLAFFSGVHIHFTCIKD